MFVPDTSVLFIAYCFFNEASNSAVRCQVARLSLSNVFQKMCEKATMVWFDIMYRNFIGGTVRNHENSQS